MAFINLQRDAFERSAVTLRPKVHFISSSAGITGSEFVAPVRSKCIKDLDFSQDLLDRIEGMSEAEIDFHNTNGQFDESDAGFIYYFNELKLFAHANNELNFFLDRYMKAVNDKSPELRFTKTIDIHRLDPSFKFNPPGGQSLMIKNNVRNVLMPHYKYKYQDSGFYYRNYNRQKE